MNRNRALLVFLLPLTVFAWSNILTLDHYASLVDHLVPGLIFCSLLGLIAVWLFEHGDRYPEQSKISFLASCLAYAITLFNLSVAITVSPNLINEDSVGGYGGMVYLLFIIPFLLIAGLVFAFPIRKLIQHRTPELRDRFVQVLLVITLVGLALFLLFLVAYHIDEDTCGTRFGINKVIAPNDHMCILTRAISTNDWRLCLKAAEPGRETCLKSIVLNRRDITSETCQYILSDDGKEDCMLWADKCCATRRV